MKRRRLPAEPIPEVDKRFVGRARQQGCLLVPIQRQTFVVGIDSARVMVFRQDGTHYASGLWRGTYTHFEYERSLNWRLLDRIDQALRAVPRWTWTRDGAKVSVMRQRTKRTKRSGRL